MATTTIPQLKSIALHVIFRTKSKQIWHTSHVSYVTPQIFYSNVEHGILKYSFQF